MSVENIIKPILEKPMFIENSFSVPFYNEAMQNELLKAVEWLKKQTIDDFTEYLTIDIINELIKENGKLLLEKTFDNLGNKREISEEFIALNPNIRVIPICDVAIRRYLSNYENTQNCIHWVLHEFCNISAKYRRGCKETEAIYSNFFVKLFIDLRAFNTMFNRYFNG